MNTFWLKVAAGTVGIVAVVVVIGMFGGGEPDVPEEPQKGFYDQVQQDKQRYLARPERVEPEQRPVAEQAQPAPNKPEVEPNRPAEPAAEPPKQPKVLYFKPLGEIEKIEAERLLNATVPGKSMGRLQIGYKLMVENCRQMIRRWPDSWYAYRAQELLISLPERYQKRYNVTEQEKDLSRFTRPRPGTEPFTFEDGR